MATCSTQLLSMNDYASAMLLPLPPSFHLGNSKHQQPTCHNKWKIQCCNLITLAHVEWSKHWHPLTQSRTWYKADEHTTVRAGIFVLAKRQHWTTCSLLDCSSVGGDNKEIVNWLPKFQMHERRLNNNHWEMSFHGINSNEMSSSHGRGLIVRTIWNLGKLILSSTDRNENDSVKNNNNSI